MRKAQSIETHLRAHGGPVQMLGLHAFFQILAKTMSPVRNLTCFHACVAVQDGMDTNKLTSCTVCPRPQHAEEEHVDDTYQDAAIKMNLLLDSQRPVEVKASCHLEPQMASRDFALYAFNRQWKHHKRGIEEGFQPLPDQASQYLPEKKNRRVRSMQHCWQDALTSLTHHF